jgi:hypothetical protein
MSPSDFPGFIIVLFVIVAFGWFLGDFIGFVPAALIFAGIFASGIVLGLLLYYLRSR